MVKLIAELHKVKEYKKETLHLAVSVADRYLAKISNLREPPKIDLVAIATISILLAAKLEQPISPSFNRMLSLLSEHQRMNLSRDGLIKLEKHIMETLEFDLQWAGPVPFMERLLKLLQVQNEPQIWYLCR